MTAQQVRTRTVSYLMRQVILHLRISSANPYLFPLYDAAPLPLPHPNQGGLSKYQVFFDAKRAQVSLIDTLQSINTSQDCREHAQMERERATMQYLCQVLLNQEYPAFTPLSTTTNVLPLQAQHHKKGTHNLFSFISHS